MELFYNIIEPSMAFSIIIFCFISVYFAIKTLYISKNNKTKDKWSIVLKLIGQFLFLIIFSYIMVELLIRNGGSLDLGSFGTSFIRPVILLNCVSTSISLRLRYAKSKKECETLKEIKRLEKING